MNLLQTSFIFSAGFCLAIVFVTYYDTLHYMDLKSSDYNALVLEPMSVSIEREPEPADDQQESASEHTVKILGGNKEEPSESTARSSTRKEWYAPNSVCSIFNNVDHPSALPIWRDNLAKIHAASRHPSDKVDEFVWHDFTAELLNIISSNRIMKGVKALPHQYWDRVGDVFSLAVKRYRHLEAINNETAMSNRGSTGGDDDALDNVKVPRKINILVMGGSVTMGVQCMENPVQETGRFARRDCAWPNRLSHFLKGMLPHDLFSVNVVTLGGTNTESATTILDYSLHDAPSPDIIIHGYSTNDMHVLTVQEALKKNITLEDMIFDVNQQFIRTVLAKTRPVRNKEGTEECLPKPPLLFYYDDYIGNEQKIILDTMAFSNAIDALSSYYGFGVISYSMTIRDLVYIDSDETWFSPKGWPERQIHPGMGMHISSMWIVAYYLLTVAINYCEVSSDATEEHIYHPIHGLPKLKDKIIVDGRPKTTKSCRNSIPPLLNRNLTLDNISSKWIDDTSTVPNLTSCDDKETILDDHSCTFSWVAGLERFLDKPKHLDKRMSPVVTDNHGWESTNDGNKLGYSVTGGLGSYFSMRIANLARPVLKMNFMTMKSYGEKWVGSMIHVNVTAITKDNVQRISTSLDILGYHEKQTSESYIHTLDLTIGANKGADIGETLLVDIRLVKGSSFKITGLAFCDH